MTTPASTISARVHQSIGDWIEVAVTTAMTASVSVVSTNLNEYDEGKNDHFNGRWCYITDFANSTRESKIYDYATSGGTLSIRGANLTTDVANKATVLIGRYSYTSTIRAVNDAIRELSDYLFRYMEDRTMVTGNILPDNSFEQWTASTASSFYSTSNASITQTTTAGKIRGIMGTTSMLVTASDTNGYAYINSDSYPRLLDLMGTDIDIATWAYPSKTDDVYMDVVYWEDASSTTVSTTTTAGSAQFTLLTRDTITIPDNIEKIEFRFRVATNAQTAYFDSARVINSSTLREYLMLSDFAEGDVAQVYVQTTGYSDCICDDIQPRYWEPIRNFSTYNDGTYQWLKLEDFFSNKRQIRVIGTSPLTELSTYTSTTEIDGRHLNLLVAYSCYCLFRNELGIASSKDTKRLEERRNYWWAIAHEYMRTIKMIPPKTFMRIG